MVCGECWASRAVSRQVATPVDSDGVTAEQVAIVAPLSVKVTVPARFTLPVGFSVTVVVKVTDWFTVEVLPGDDEFRFMFTLALLIVSKSDVPMLLAE